MPIKIRRTQSGQFQVSTPGGIKAHGTTRGKAEAQRRLLKMMDRRKNPYALRGKSSSELLEGVVDDTSLSEVLFTLGVICSEKARHIYESYDDKQLADAWERAALDLGQASQKQVFRDISI